MLHVLFIVQLLRLGIEASATGWFSARNAETGMLLSLGWSGHTRTDVLGIRLIGMFFCIPYIALSVTY